VVNRNVPVDRVVEKVRGGWEKEREMRHYGPIQPSPLRVCVDRRVERIRGKCCACVH
jgi:uncharacterized protein (DUF433 family)